MRDVVVVDSVRTGLAKSFRGSFNWTRSDDMAAFLIDALIDRNPQFDPGEVDDIICELREIHAGEFILPSAGVGEHLRYQARTALGGDSDPMKSVFEALLDVPLAQNEFGIGQDGLQDIVEVVGDPPCEESNCLKLLCVTDLGLQPVALVLCPLSFGQIEGGQQRRRFIVPTDIHRRELNNSLDIIERLEPCLFLFESTQSDGGRGGDILVLFVKQIVSCETDDLTGMLRPEQQESFCVEIDERPIS